MLMLKIILGPTASGKSNYAINWAKKIGASVVSADAFQVYKGFDIGTAKVSKQIRQQIPHYLIDIKNPDQPYHVAEFIQLSRILIQEYQNKNIPLIICGGTAMYLYALLNNFEFQTYTTDSKVKMQLELDLKEKGLEYLVEHLKKNFPSLANTLDLQNPRRVVRALEKGILGIEKLPGKQTPENKNIEIIGLKTDKQVLIQCINQRVDQMMKMGLMDEVKSLKKSWPLSSQAFQAIGYKECLLHLDDGMPLEQMIELIKIRTRQFAKRQMTWFKKFENVRWIEV